MNDSVKYPTIKKHVFLIFFGGIFLISLFITGFILVKNSDNIESIKYANDMYFFVGRMILYSAVILSWKPFVSYVFRNYKSKDKKIKVKILVNYQNNLIIYIALFELIFVQNALRYLVQWWL